MTENKKKGKVT